MWLRTKALYPDDLFVRVDQVNRTSLTIPIELRSMKGKHSITKNALVDSGATANFIHWKLVDRFHMKKEKLPTPLIVRNADNTSNIRGKITHKVVLAVSINSHKEVITFYVSDLGSDDLILGHTWLNRHNPEVDWTTPSLSFSCCPPSCSLSLTTKWQRAYTPKANFKAGQ